MALTKKQERFVEEYLVDLNATQAAIRAGYSERSADKIGPELLGKTRVSEAVQAAMRERSRRAEITQDMVVDELAKIGLAEAHDYTDADLKVGNKIKALELLGKHLGLFDGRGGREPEASNNLFEAIQDSTGEDVELSDLPEIQ